jgi:hypothetical protein
MISRENFVKVVNQIAETYNSYYLALETMGITNTDDSDQMMKLIDTTLLMLVSEMGDKGTPCHGDIEVQKDSEAIFENDMPLILHYCWNLSFGDGYWDTGDIPTIIIEGEEYKIDNAGVLYDCLSHLNQWRAHYGIDG